MRVELLGPVAVSDDGRSLTVGGPRLRALLARLAVDGGRAVGSGALIEALWEDEPPADPSHALQSLVTRLRRALGSAGGVLATTGGYRLDVAADDVDAGRFERRARAGLAEVAERPARARQTLREALSLWRGPALADLVDGYRFAALAADRLEDLRVSAALAAAEADLRCGDGEGTVAALEELAVRHPLDERVARLLLAALQADGRQAEALAAYERTRTALADELGARPSGELQAAHLALLRDAPVVAVGVPPGGMDGGQADDADPRRSRREPAARRSAAGVPRPLPTALTSFVGRETEVARLDALLERERLVTLVGPGGAGKTRLADETAALLQARGAVDPGPTGNGASGDVGGGGRAVRRVELAPMTEGHEILAALLDVFGLRDTGPLLSQTGPRPPDALGRLLEGLAEVDALVLLDNCEHVVADAAAFADALLRGCPGLRILATSREPLAIGGEHVVALAPLRLPEQERPDPEQALEQPAVRLFADRAAAAATGFVVDETTVASVVEICRRLDGMPLALELAAARLRTMPLPELAARLDDRFRLLTSGPRTADARQRTLRAVVDWSWELLSAPERRLARRLAVLPGGATLAAAEAICSGDGVPRDDVLDLLAALVDKSVLQVRSDPDAGARYRMLETLREYGLEQLDRAGETERLRRAHARWFAAFAVRGDAAMRGPEQVVWLGRLRAERENLQAAIRRFADEGDAHATARMAVTLLLFWLASGNQGEAIEATRIALEVPGERDPVDQLLSEGIQAFASTFGHGDAPEPTPEQQRDALTRVLDTPGADRPIWAAVRPIFAHALERPDLVPELQQQALRHEDPWVRATALVLDAQLAENDGDIARSRASNAAAVAGFRAIGDHWGMSVALASSAGPLMLDGDLAGAEAAAGESRDAAVALGTDQLASASFPLAEVRLRQGRLQEAYEITLATADEIGHDTTFSDINLARIARLAGDRDEARRRTAAVLGKLDGRPPFGLGHERAMALAGASMLALEDERMPEALGHLREAHAAALVTRDLPVIAIVALALADALRRLGQPEAAVETLGAAAVLRGTDDRLNPDVVRLAAPLTEALGATAYAAAYARGRALDRDGALARVDPSSLDGLG